MPLRQHVKPQDVVDLLNELLQMDRDAIGCLVEYRARCHDNIVNHPTVQCVGQTVGMLGILNGLFGVEDRTNYGAIAANYDDDDRLTHFSLVEHSKIKV